MKLKRYDVIDKNGTIYSNVSMKVVINVLQLNEENVDRLSFLNFRDEVVFKCVVGPPVTVKRVD